jgi:hypothetical protein
MIDVHKTHLVTALLSGFHNAAVGIEFRIAGQ